MLPVIQSMAIVPSTNLSEPTTLHCSPWVAPALKSRSIPWLSSTTIRTSASVSAFADQVHCRGTSSRASLPVQSFRSAATGARPNTGTAVNPLTLTIKHSSHRATVTASVGLRRSAIRCKVWAKTTTCRSLPVTKCWPASPSPTA